MSALNSEELTREDRLRIVALSLTRNIGWVLIHRLIAHFGALEPIFSTSTDELRCVAGIGAQIAASIQAINLERLAADLETFEASYITVATWQDSFYPRRLADLPDRPLTIFWKGAFAAADERTISIVGTREAHPTSIRVATKYAAGVASQGWTVVSGLARGIDSAAHQGALAGNGRTMAILGCGVNRVYPPENRQLATQVLANGVILSEVHPDTSPSPNTLMRRNRLIAALGNALIVVEAGETSGALYAARCAHELGRTVFALDNSAGNAALLAEFAQPLPESVEALIAQLE